MADDELDLEENWPYDGWLSSTKLPILKEVDKFLRKLCPAEDYPRTGPEQHDKELWYVSLNGLSNSQRKKFWAWLERAHPEWNVGSA